MRPGSKTGVTNGLAVLLDAENYNIGYYKSVTQGVKFAVHDHKLDIVSAWRNVLCAIVLSIIFELGQFLML